MSFTRVGIQLDPSSLKHARSVAHTISCKLSQDQHRTLISARQSHFRAASSAPTAIPSPRTPLVGRSGSRARIAS